MTFFASIGFLAPWLLLGLAALPILWILLRATPPAPIKKFFPAVSLLLGLEDKETTPDRTPWWLLLLRIGAIALVIIGFAGPILNPKERIAGQGPLLLALDASWASAYDWGQRKEKLKELLADADQDDRAVAVILLSDGPQADNVQFNSAQSWRDRIDGLTPNAWAPDYEGWIDVLSDLDFAQTVWFSDGLAHEGAQSLEATLSSKGDLSFIRGETESFALRPLNFQDGALRTTLWRSAGQSDLSLRVAAIGLDPSGIRRELFSETMSAPMGQTDIELEIDMPTELRNRIEEVRLSDFRSAGSVVLADDAIQRRKVALLGSDAQEGGNLLSGLHFLRKALVPTAEVIEADLETLLQANPDVLIFDDIGVLNDDHTTRIVEWVEQGGTLLRFAGPKLTASELGLFEEHPLLPVRLRAGGRTVGGAMSWGEPKALRAFDEDSPFFGLSIPSDVSVSSQVIAQPDPNLADRVLATLADGTPLVTAKDMEQGRVILFHVTANAEWSNLALSGLFVQMLERLAISSRSGQSKPEDLEGRIWNISKTLSGFGELIDAPNLPGIDGAKLVDATASAELPSGVYAFEDRRVALNAVSADQELSPKVFSGSNPVIGLETSQERFLKADFLSVALILLMLDILATLFLGGRLRLSRAAATIVGLVFVLSSTHPIYAAEDDEILAANNTVLAFVVTGNPRVDQASQAGLMGLSTELFRRTSIEPIPPVGLNLDEDELALYSFIYWPMDASQPALSDAATAKVNTYLRQGGLILFDTRDANISGAIGGSTSAGRKLREVAGKLDIPRLEPIPEDHVLTRTFYLLNDFPGRHANAPVWVEAAPPDAVQLEGIPFRNLNDGVSPIVIGGNDWAAAWAIDENGRYIFPVGRGEAGERQREFAYRFGVNLLMHVMTGNYKSDQVHVPALLERLGQ